MKSNDLINRSVLLARLHTSLGKAAADCVYSQRYDYYYKAIDIVQQMPAAAPESLRPTESGDISAAMSGAVHTAAM